MTQAYTTVPQAGDHDLISLYNVAAQHGLQGGLAQLRSLKTAAEKEIEEIAQRRPAILLRIVMGDAYHRLTPERAGLEADDMKRQKRRRQLEDLIERIDLVIPEIEKQLGGATP